MLPFLAHDLKMMRQPIETCLFFVVLLLNAVHGLILEGDPRCPYNCSCGYSHIDCTHLGLFSESPVTNIMPLRLGETNNVYLSYNNIRTIATHAFSAYTETHWLDLSHNPIVHIAADAFAGMDKLFGLVITHTYLRVLPSMSSELPLLWSLKLSNNLLQDINPGFMQSIRHEVGMDIARNRLTSWPSLANISSLDISHNQIRNIPENAFDNSPSIRYLDITNSSIREISSAFKNLSLLDGLNAADNDIGDAGFATNDLSPNITRLNISNTGITRLPISLQKMFSLTDLTASNNRLETIRDEEMLPLHNLRSLDIRNCSLSRIPAALGLLKQLEGLYLEDNPISSIERNDLNGMVALHAVYLENTHVRYISPNAFDGLPLIMYIGLVNCSLTELPTGIRNASYLEYLGMAGNPVNCSCNMAWFLKAKSILYAHVTGQCYNGRSKELIHKYITTELPRCP